MRDSNTIATAIPMFLRSSNMTALVRILSYVWVSGISKMVAYNRKWIYNTYLPQILTWNKTIRIGPVMILDAEKINIAVGFSLLSRMQAEMHVISYPLSVTGPHLSFITHHDTR